MAQQAKNKNARPARRSKTPTVGTEDVGATAPDASDVLSQRLAQAERERNDALRQLADANERIKQLEGVQEQVVNRIDWVVDSLHTLKTDRP